MNILFFGPNGSGKGTQGAILKDKYSIPHIESGAIFRENIKGGTKLGIKAKEYIDKGDLVPDEITIPMILDRLQKDDGKDGWLLDGFPRNRVQAEKLDESLKKANMKLDIVVEIILDREIAKNRIMGRRLCVNDNNHPNNIFIDAIKPNGDKCRVCGGELIKRADYQDKDASISAIRFIISPNPEPLHRLTILKILPRKRVWFAISPWTENRVLKRSRRSWFPSCKMPGIIRLLKRGKPDPDPWNRFIGNIFIASRF